MILNSPTISGSLTVTGNIIASGSITLSGSVDSASYAATASFVALAQSASNAVAAATASFANAFTVASTLTAQTLVVQTITSSVDFVTGSTRFGSISANTHVFTGSMSVSGSGTFSGGVIVTGIGLNSSLKLTNSTATTGADWHLYSLNNGNFGLYNNTSGSYALQISPAGNVGIGTSTPAQTLEVNGNILASSTGKIGFRYSSGDGNYYSYIRSATAGGVGPIVIGGGFESGGGGNEAIRLVTNANPGERTVLSINNAGTSTFSGGVVADNFNSVNGLSSTYSLGTIAQNATITQSIPKSGFWIITNGGNNSGLIMITRAGGSLGVQLIFSTNGNGDVVVGTTSEPSGGNYLRLWMSAVGVLSIKNVNAYTGPYFMTSIATY
jgi:hypothetical protein